MNFQATSLCSNSDCRHWQRRVRPIISGRSASVTTVPTSPAAIAWFEGGPAPERAERGFALSAARSVIFNAVLAERINAGTWNRAARRRRRESQRQRQLLSAPRPSTTPCVTAVSSSTCIRPGRCGTGTHCSRRGDRRAGDADGAAIRCARGRACRRLGLEPERRPLRVPGSRAEVAHRRRGRASAVSFAARLVRDWRASRIDQQCLPSCDARSRCLRCSTDVYRSQQHVDGTAATVYMAGRAEGLRCCRSVAAID